MHPWLLCVNRAVGVCDQVCEVGPAAAVEDAFGQVVSFHLRQLERRVVEEPVGCRRHLRVPVAWQAVVGLALIVHTEPPEAGVVAIERPQVLASGDR